MTVKRNTSDTADKNSIHVDPLEVPVEPSSEARAIRGAAIDSVQVKMAVEIGRVDLMIKDLRVARQGTVITLDRSVGDPLDVRVNGKLIARGAVVSTEGRKYGIRITEMVVPEDAEDRR